MRDGGSAPRLIRRLIMNLISRIGNTLWGRFVVYQQSDALKTELRKCLNTSITADPVTVLHIILGEDYLQYLALNSSCQS